MYKGKPRTLTRQASWASTQTTRVTVNGHQGKETVVLRVRLGPLDRQHRAAHKRMNKNSPCATKYQRDKAMLRTLLDLAQNLFTD